MKRIQITLLTWFIALTAFAIEQSALTMVSYEQGWLDSQGTLALKNNTEETIKNVSFQITYFDMSGNALDYQEFFERVEIAPGMTRKFDIPAYEHSRNYHYYKSENMPGGSPAFKIQFTLKDFNVKQEVQDNDDDSYEESTYNYRSNYSKDDDTPSAGMILLGLAIILIILGFVVGMYVLVAVMAQKRKRNVVIWILLSIVTTPFLMAIILLVIGDAVNGNEDGYSRIQ